MVSEWMPNGCIDGYVKAHSDLDRLGLVGPPFLTLFSTSNGQGSFSWQGSLRVLSTCTTLDWFMGTSRRCVFLSLQLLPCLDEFTHKVKYTDRRSWPSSPRIFWSTQNTLRSCESVVLKLKFSRWYSQMDESGVDISGAIWIGGE